MKRATQDKPAPAGEVVPTVGMASRTLIGAMMARLAARGFDGLTPAFAAVMPLLDATGIRPTVLAQRAGVTKQAASQLVRLLEGRGYVEQVPDTTDERAKVIRLTRRGVALRAACFEVRQEIEEVARETLGDARLERLQSDLAKLQQALASKP
jgi:DNA-binding MarR family transcriptional regulator